ncbi:MAG TPA: PKD domain-containing protein [Thermoplasmata archaeon]|nr:PKD domain-containing protein [Thermoplasmata archaeon]
MAYDPLDHETVYFGGCLRLVCATNQTWVFSGGTWLNLTDPHDAPPARYGATMDYDGNMGGLLLFGGYGSSSYLDDTWFFHAGVWTNLSPTLATNPPARVDASMAFVPDPEENGSVLFGGYEPGLGGWANDTWIWHGAAGWVLLQPSGPVPPPSGHTQMAYDPVEGALVLFGCGYGGCAVPNQTWELYSGQWWHVVPPSPVPPYRSDASMTYDAGLSAIVLFGGLGASGYLSDTWKFAGGVWAKLSVGIAPPARSSAMMASDSGGSPPVLFGGANGRLSSLNDTWVLEAPPTVGISATPTMAETSTPVTLNASASGGTYPYRVVFAFGDGASAVAAVSAILPTGFVFTAAHSYLKAGAYSPSVNLTDALGALVTSRVVPAVLVTRGPTVGPPSEPGSGDVGLALSFQGGPVTNGTPPFRFDWSFGDGGTATGQNASHTFTAPGIFSGNLTVTDALGGSSVASFTEIIHPIPAATIAVTPHAPVTGTVTTFFENVTGGSAPFRYTWRFGDGGTSTVPSPQHVFTTAGSFTVELWVNDSLGASAHQSLIVPLAPGPSTPPATNSSGGSTGAPGWFWPGIGALVVVGALGGFLLLRRGRSTKRV